ncbi:MAG: phosphatase PAP2 family protein [Ignavibacterium sp.]|nr:phosphatase PAP2 family protein [Ignavibacterium sp.]MCX7611255.1 phosphatase PAP2 family protein [Ignavibacterium sp.]MDW8375253.1 phosphatase PAP2 family protein [Ignavibacteriales bacterium]
MLKLTLLNSIFIFSFFVSAQNVNQLKQDLQSIYNNSKEYFQAPLKFSSEDFQTTGIISCFVSLSTLMDSEIKNFSQSKFDSSLTLLRKFDSYYHIEFISASTLSLFLYGNITNKKEVRELSVNLISSSLLTGLTTYGLKTLFGRTRPYETDDKYEFNFFELEDKFQAFPSGHTSLAFSFSTIMAEQNKTFIWKTFWYSAATLVGFSRIYNNKHWFSDVLMGAIIGYYTAKFVLNRDKNYSSDNINLPTNKIVFLIRL